MISWRRYCSSVMVVGLKTCEGGGLEMVEYEKGKHGRLMAFE